MAQLQDQLPHPEGGFGKESGRDGEDEFLAEPSSSSCGGGVNMEGEETKEYLQVRLDVIHNKEQRASYLRGCMDFWEMKF